MRVVVRHGHFAFYPRDRDEVLHFRRKFGFMLFAEEDYFTFFSLLNLPKYSLIGSPYGLLGTPALLTFAGSHAHEVMRANRFVYSMKTLTIVPAAAFAAFAINFSQSRDFILSPKSFVQPGCLYSVDNIVRGFLTGYTGDLDIDTEKLAISSVEAII